MPFYNITYLDWIKNPSQSRSKMVGETEVARAIYNDKYNKMILRVGGKIDYLLYKEKDDKFLIYVKLPSEKTFGLFYDVVVEFETKDDVKKKLNHLGDYKVKFFSNDPNFIYTYAYTYNKNGLIIPELRHKIDSRSLKEKPNITNPNTNVGYVKSLYFVYLFMLNRGLFNKVNWLYAKDIKTFFNKEVNDYIMNSDLKLKQAQDLVKYNRSAHKNSVAISTTSPNGLADAARTANMIDKSVKKSHNIKMAIKAKNVKEAKKVAKRK